ncbi:MAG TPA: hypothetical protein VGI81_23730 [Tepidisphaeraceae bacterium]|jgi:hypothetical protein
MQMCNALVVIDPHHPDQNTLREIVEAVKDAGGQVLEVEPDRHVIEVLIPTRELPIVAAMGGVSYVRPVLTYERITTPAEPAMAELEESS